MRYADLYESEFLTNEDDIINWMRKSFIGFDLDKLTIEPDGIIYNENLELNTIELEIKVNFKSVTGYFDTNQFRISSLKGSPKTVGKYFSCNGTNIDSLEFCPNSVGGDFYCSRTKITSLKFCPKITKRDFYCYDIQIKDPKEYRWALYCEIGGEFNSSNGEVSKIINTYAGSVNKKHWAKAINLLSKVKL